MIIRVLYYCYIILYDFYNALFEDISFLNDWILVLYSGAIYLLHVNLKKKDMKKLLLFMILLGSVASAENYTIKSPNSKLVVDVKTGTETTYTVSFDGQKIIDPSPLSMTFNNGVTIGRNMKVKSVKRVSEDKILKPIIHVKSNDLESHYF